MRISHGYSNASAGNVGVRVAPSLARWCADFTDSLLTLSPFFSNSPPYNQGVKHGGGGRNCSTQTRYFFQRANVFKGFRNSPPIAAIPQTHWITGNFTGNCVGCKHTQLPTCFYLARNRIITFILHGVVSTNRHTKIQPVTGLARRCGITVGLNLGSIKKLVQLPTNNATARTDKMGFCQFWLLRSKSLWLNLLAVLPNVLPNGLVIFQG